MKKQIGALILVFVLSGCTVSEEKSESVNGGFSSGLSETAGGLEGSSSRIGSAPEKMESSWVSERSQKKGGPESTVGTEPQVQEVLPLTQRSGHISLGEFHELLLVDEFSDMPERIPVYSDPYPSDHGGPEYEFTEEVKGIRRRNLTEFLDTLYGNHEEREYKTSEDGPHYLVSYQADTLEAWGREYGVHVYTKGYGVRGDAESGNLLDNEMIQAALEYTGIEQSQIRRVMKYKGDGKAPGDVYIIAAQSEDILENMQFGRFRYISVGLDTQDKKNRDTVRIVVEKNEPAESEMCETVSYQEALNYIKQKYADKPVTEIKAEARYERTVAKGFFVPCYKFYVKCEQELDGQDSGAHEYDVTYILMAKGWEAETLRKAATDAG